MSTTVLILVGGIIIVFLARLIIRKKNPHSSSQFSGGRAGATTVQIPGSSAALHAELIAAAEPQMGHQKSLEFKMIFALVNSDRYAEAIGKIDQALGSQPGPDYKVLLLWVKSNVCQRAGEVEQEIAVLDTLCSLRSNRMFEMNLGNAYAKVGDYAAAEKRFQNAISLADGVYPLAVYNLGCLYCSMKRKYDASLQLKALENSAESVPAELTNRLRLRISELG